MWSYKTPGIPDDAFERSEGVPITKEEVRALQISKSRLRPGDTVHDIGCGSGSFTVEAALQVGASGSIHAIDSDPRAIELTRRNLARFGVENATVILGDAREKVSGLPEADAVFIGGTCGHAAEIMGLCGQKLKDGGRIVVGTILVETLAAVLGAVEVGGFSDVDVAQVAIAKGRKTPTGTMMLARNTITVVSASKGRA
ncbi:precorrin-6B methylase [Cenarchaeum symbiosum A]|uniref:Probable cobalt-precorrin-6B C(15)-methyltransferase (decarboxylating) n=1 Tax=Cenarchaeum symbiosum (strain A) TaxID=414004 RepID=A0RYW0_CENSY|nr:precorrin-6B methylase [Cenarchaeum symbiosum A]